MMLRRKGFKISSLPPSYSQVRHCSESEPNRVECKTQAARKCRCPLIELSNIFFVISSSWTVSTVRWITLPDASFPDMWEEIYSPAYSRLCPHVDVSQRLNLQITPSAPYCRHFAAFNAYPSQSATSKMVMPIWRAGTLPKFLNIRSHRVRF